MKPEIFIGTLKKSIELSDLTKENILKTICKELQMDFDEVKNRKTRKSEFVYVRQLYSYFCRKFTNESLDSIGKFINKDHATIIWGNKQINNYCEFDKGVKNQVKKINSILKNKVVNLKEYELDEIGNEIILKYQ